MTVDPSRISHVDPIVRNYLEHHCNDETLIAYIGELVAQPAAVVHTAFGTVHLYNGENPANGVHFHCMVVVTSDEEHFRVQAPYLAESEYRPGRVGVSSSGRIYYHLHAEEVQPTIAICLLDAMPR